MANDRSLRAEVRNPVLGMRCAASLRALPPEAKAVLAEVLFEIASTSRVRADECWRKHKAPMAYWKAVSVYSKHIARALTFKRGNTGEAS
jgi:hypothetical protein